MQRYKPIFSPTPPPPQHKKEQYFYSDEKFHFHIKFFKFSDFDKIVRIQIRPKMMRIRVDLDILITEKELIFKFFKYKISYVIKK